MIIIKDNVNIYLHISRIFSLGMLLQNQYIESITTFNTKSCKLFSKAAEMYRN